MGTSFFTVFMIKPVLFSMFINFLQSEKTSRENVFQGFVNSNLNFVGYFLKKKHAIY